MVFTAVGVEAKKAVKLWRHGVRSTSRLASISAWEEEMAGIVNLDKERLNQFLEARPLGHRSRSLPLRSDHPIISPTLRGSGQSWHFALPLAGLLLSRRSTTWWMHRQPETTLLSVGTRGANSWSLSVKGRFLSRPRKSAWSQLASVSEATARPPAISAPQILSTSRPMAIALASS